MKAFVPWMSIGPALWHAIRRYVHHRVLWSYWALAQSGEMSREFRALVKQEGVDNRKKAHAKRVRQ